MLLLVYIKLQVYFHYWMKTKKLVSFLLCCWYKDHANLGGSVITRMVC